MEQVLEFFRKLFDTADWPPRWHCGKWTEFHGWFYIISDLLIWSAYFALPLIILKYISKRVEAKFVRAYFLFAAFILACGSTHLLDAIMFWFPAYRINALVRFFTGVISWVTVFYVIKILPTALQLRTHDQLEKEIAERERAEDELKSANDQLNEAQEIAKLGYWQWDVVNNKLEWSKNLFDMYGFPPSSKGITFDDFINKVHPDDKDYVQKSINESFETKNFKPFIHKILLDDGSVKILQSRGQIITGDDDNIIRMIGTGQDITEQQKAQQELLQKTTELEATNSELQRFAYVASHDLQEPLRKILTFASMLKSEAGENLNEKATSYVDKMVQSSTRMQRLIDDILRFSRFKADITAFEKVDLNEILEQVVSDIEVTIEKTGAQINKEQLPVIDAIPFQLHQLFQNLISNGIKFRKEGVVPEINIKISILSDLEAETKINELPESHHWHAKYERRLQIARISIIDNGVGFDPQYSNQIFEIFQRLSTEKTYEGTGIGLAICKKIVENHNEHIEAESTPGEGAAFHVYLPIKQKGS